MEFASTTGFSRYVSWSPLSLTVLLIGVLVMFFGPRKWVLPTFLALSALMSLALHIIIFGQNFMPHRVLLFCAGARFLIRGEYRGLTLSAMDKAGILLCCWLVFTEMLQAGSSGFVYAVANNFIDGLGTYFLCRILIRDRQELLNTIGVLAAVCAVVGAFMLVEFTTKRNLLAALGAVQDVAQERHGRARCAASFGIPITAGTFGAVLLPLFVAFWWQEGKMKKWAIPGCIAATIITVTSGSASPLSTYLLAIIGLLAWRVRDRMRTIRWAIAASLVVLHLVMKAPVWALISRVQIVPGASAYHRFNVLDTFISHIGEWWVCGVRSTEEWGWLMDDVANQYCIIAKHGGLLGVILFIRLIALGFREIGVTRRQAAADRASEFLIWSLGVLLFAHATAFFGISYYDQTKVFWYVALAMVASARLLVPEPAAEAIGEKIEQPADELSDVLPAGAH